MREQYRTAGLDEHELAAGPMAQFHRWFTEAAEAHLYEPNAMVLSTADTEGRPSSRTVLLKGYDERGFAFYTNYESRKGREIAANPHVSLLFPWHPLARQVIVSGRAERVGRDETAEYFRTRPHGSQLGAWASAQSSVIGSRAEIEGAYEELAARYPEGPGGAEGSGCSEGSEGSEGGQVPVPPHWGGILVVPETVEFWQGRQNRLHDRLRYVERGGEWVVERLAP
ncbi:pyridoxamine 5'-phosphate oxidase [Streptomyces sp. KLOTTS4A1]|uniref:pyridoxamine 5'-phosphate oxidase n=1 Tax=Streptomyces sp. KLOTTS4A1 TaxID=3390996 RepID=UPI0039F4B928